MSKLESVSSEYLCKDSLERPVRESMSWWAVLSWSMWPNGGSIWSHGQDLGFTWSNHSCSTSPAQTTISAACFCDTTLPTDWHWCQGFAGDDHAWLEPPTGQGDFGASLWALLNSYFSLSCWVLSLCPLFWVCFFWPLGPEAVPPVVCYRIEWFSLGFQGKIK